MSGRSLMFHVCVLTLAVLASSATFAAQSLDVPMDRNLKTVLIRFGPQNTQPATWQGTYRVEPGRVVATEGWRFAVDDYATVAEFKFESRRFYPRFWNSRGQDPKTFPIEPNGVQLTLADLTPRSVLYVETSKGVFEVPVGMLGYGPSKTALDGQADYRRLPTSRQIVKAATEDGYPGAVAGSNGERLCGLHCFHTWKRDSRSVPR